jgi:ParB-like chromosome segregation protein Spo0J
MVGLLNLPESVKTMIEDGKLTMSHARVLSKMEDKGQVE